MKNKKITLVDIIGNCDKHGQPIGHPLKVVNEIYDLLNDYYDIDLFIPKNYENKMISSPKYVFKFYCDITKVGILDKLFNYFKQIVNVVISVIKSKNRVIWFINPGYSIYIAIALLPYRMLKGKDIYITCFMNNSAGVASRIKQWFEKKCHKKICCIIVTNKNIEFMDVKTFYLPDYLFLNKKYIRYIIPINKKNDYTVCLGTMNHVKRLEELVDVFNAIQRPLKIVGHFYDIDRYNELKKKVRSPHILIENIYLSDDDYYNLISDAKYVVLPYPNDFYENRTSGLLLESMFLGTIPIAPKKLLEFNSIPGLGYDDMCELQDKTFWNHDYKHLHSELEKHRCEYNSEVFCGKIIELLGR